MPCGGERVYKNGIYRPVHYLHPEHDGQIVVLANQVLPRCSECKDVEYILIKGAPDAREVADFNPAQKKKRESAAGR
jgi:hypothetical protein